MDEEIRLEAYRIYEWRCSSWMFDYGRIGSAEGDWAQAEKVVEARRRAEICGISTCNRLEKYF